MMNVDATLAEVAAVRDSLAQDQRVLSWTFFDSSESYERAMSLFANDQSFLTSLKPESTPPCFECFFARPTEAAEFVGGFRAGLEGVLIATFMPR
jgi:hypothetical protein